MNYQSNCATIPASIIALFLGEKKKEKKKKEKKDLHEKLHVPAQTQNIPL